LKNYAQKPGADKKQMSKTEAEAMAAKKEKTGKLFER